MRVNMGREGRNSSSLSANGGSMLGALILANSPSQPLEAATKYYVDTTFANLNANNVLDGTLPISSLPGFTGDASSSQGTNVITLSNLGITPGSYAKVIVDIKGRVTGNDILSDSDIPIVSWNKIQNKPNTVEGYEISDALTVSGGTLTGNLSVGSPISPLSAANKGYVDGALSNTSSAIGDIIRKSFSTTPAGFLRCNGGLVDKTTYADLYSVIGDNFAANTLIGSGRPWEQQYEINNTQGNDINTWVAGTALPGVLTESAVVVTKNRVYLLGGNNGTASVSTVYTAPITGDGTLGTWTTGTGLPAVVGLAKTIVIKNYVYLIGGYVAGTSAVAAVRRAPINSDGTLGAWVSSTSLPSQLMATCVFATKTKVFVLGGSNFTTPQSLVYSASINSDGTLGSWNTETSLPSILVYSSVVVTKNRVYLVGGRVSGAYTSNVYTAPINIDGTIGSWSSAASLPGAIGASQVVTTKNRVYVLGGNDAVGNVVSTVYTAPINTDGTLGTWATGTSLPGPASISQAIVTSSKVYLLGRYTGSAHTGGVYVGIFYGGLSSYSDYYDGTIVTLNQSDTTKFALPDFSLREKNDINIYIKY